MVKVLIVEDDRTEQILLKALVEKMGHTAFLSPNGKHALEALQVNDDISLVVSDYQMPEMDGSSLASTLKASRGTKRKIPFIMVSGVMKVSAISSCLADGVDFFLPKPVDGAELQNYVKLCLSQTRGS
ncbi:MAG: response regulator [Myxococcales bacterium]